MEKEEEEEIEKKDKRNEIRIRIDLAVLIAQLQLVWFTRTVFCVYIFFSLVFVIKSHTRK